MVVLQDAFTLEHSAVRVSRPFNCMYVCISDCVLVVFVPRWFEKLQFNKILLVEVGQALLSIPGSSGAKILVDSNLFP